MLPALKVSPARARGIARGPRSHAVSAVGAAVAFFGFVVLGFLLYFSQFSGTVRWILGLALLGIVATLAWAQVSLRAREPAPLEREPRTGALRTGDLHDLAQAVRRAEQGLEYSQTAIAQRAREAFAERVRLASGIPVERMREIQRDAKALGDLVRDRILADFLKLDMGNRDDRYRWVREVRRGEGFSVAFKEVLARMEGWR